MDSTGTSVHLPVRQLPKPRFNATEHEKNALCTRNVPVPVPPPTRTGEWRRLRGGALASRDRGCAQPRPPRIWFSCAQRRHRPHQRCLPPRGPNARVHHAKAVSQALRAFRVAGQASRPDYPTRRLWASGAAGGTAPSSPPTRTPPARRPRAGRRQGPGGASPALQSLIIEPEGCGAKGRGAATVHKAQ